MDFLRFLQFSLGTPKPYGAFHIVSFILVILVTIAACIFGRNIKEKTLSKILFILWIVLIVLEIYKQIVFSYVISGDTVTWSYSWFVFPYQFCATPLTFIPFIALNKASNKVSAFIKEGCIVFCSTLNLFAGLSVMFYPGDVFMQYLGVDIHTMIHHGAQVILGVYIYVYYHNRLKYISFLKALPVFVFFLINAMILNAIIPPLFSKDAVFNMFFISWRFPCTLPILADVYTKVPYIIFLLIYILAFALVGFIIYNIIYWITYLIDKQKPKETDKYNNTISTISLNN